MYKRQTLDVSKNTKLQTLDCSDNGSLTGLDLSKNPELKTLILGRASDSFSSIDLSHNPLLEVFESEYMGFSKPSVSRAIGLLKSGGYVTMDKGGHLELTEEGRSVAENIYEKHTLLAKFLMTLGVDEATATEDACKMEHVISDTSFKAIKKHAGME